MRVFESVGRMFLLTDIAEVRKNLTSKMEKSEEKIKALQVCVSSKLDSLEKKAWKKDSEIGL